MKTAVEIYLSPATRDQGGLLQKSRGRAVYRIFISLFFLLVSTGQLFAQTASNSITSGPWNSPSTWLGGVVPTGTNEVFINALHTVTLSANTTISSFIQVTGTLALGGFNFSAGSLAGNGTVSTASGTPTVTVGSDNTNSTYSGAFNGSLALIKAGTGTLSISGTSNYTGATTVQNGVIRLVSATALGSTSLVTVNSGAAFQLEGGLTVSRNFSVAGTGVSSTGVLRNNSGTNVITGTVTLTAASTFQSDGGSLNLDGVTALALGTNDITFTGTGNFDVGGIITGSGIFTKEGTGTAILAGVNTFSGNKVVNAGAINVQDPSALGASGTITVNPGGSLQIQGGINFARPFTINGTGPSSLGALRNISGNNTISGTVTLGSASRIHSDAGTLTLSAAGTSVSSPNHNLTFGGSASILVSTAMNLGSAQLAKEGSGTTTLTVAHTFTGGTNIAAGVLNIQNAGALGASGTITVTSGATLQMQGGLSFTRALTINGNGVSNLGAIRSISGTNTISSTITLGSAARINVDADSLLLTAANVISGTGLALTIGGNGSARASGTFTLGGGTMNKDGNGTLLMNVANTYTGNTNISAGTIIPNNINAFGTSGTVAISGSGTLGLQGAVTFARPITLSSVGNGNVGGIRNISGNNSISGLITLTGNSRINSDLNTLTLTAANVLTGTTQALTLGGAGNITFNRAITTTSGTVTKDGAGTVTLNEQNTYTGLTTVSAGTLAYGDNNILSTGNLTVTGGVLSLSTFSDTVGVVTVSGGSITGTGTLFSITNFSFSGGTISANLGGDIGLIKTGTGTLTLTGNNNFTGQVWIQNGAISVATINNVVSGSPTSNLGAPNSAANGTIRLGSTTTTGQLIYTGAAFTTDRVIELAGTTGGGIITHNGSGALVFNSAITVTAAGAKSLTLGGTNTADNFFNGTISDGSGTVSLVKSDAGRWILPNANTLTGTITINAGSINIRNNTAFGTGGAVSITSGASLELQGSITLTKSVTVTGTGAASVNGTLRSVSGNNVLAGTFSATTNTTHRIQSDASATLSLSGTPAIDHSTRNVTIQGSGNTTIPLGSNMIGTTGSLTKEGTGTLIMDGSKFTTGQVTITAGTIRLGGNNRFDAATVLSVTGVLDMNGFSQTVNGLIGSGTINSGVAGTCSLIIDNSSGTARTYTGVINNGSGTLTVRKLGTTDQTFSGTSNYSGQTYIDGGRLIITGVLANTGTNSSIGTGNSVAAVTIANGGSLDYNSGTARSTNRPIVIIASGSIEMAGNTTLTLTGGITGTNANLTLNTSGGTGRTITVTTVGLTLGTGGVTKIGTGVVNMNVSNAYSGTTTISAGTYTIGNTTAIPAASPVVNDATLNLNGTNISIASLAGTTVGAQVRNNSATACTLTMSSASGSTNYSGAILNGTGVLNIIKAGAYTQIFGGNNTYTGSTTINGGILRANSNTAFSNSSAHILANTAGVELDMTGYDMTVATIEGGGVTGGIVRLGTATLTLAGTASYNYSGRIIGEGVGGIVKNGTGVFTLNRSPEYEGFTRIRQGTLRAGVDLTFIGTVIISDTLTGRFDCSNRASTAPFLSFNSTRQVGGTWGSTASAATNRTNTYFTSGSTGTIFVNDGRREGYWLGTVSSNWFTAGNWHDNIVPTSTTEVVLEDMSINAPSLNGTGNCGNIIIFPGAELTLVGTSTLNVFLEMFNNGQLIPNSSTIVFRRATGTTRVIARPNGTDIDFNQVQYIGSGTLRFQTSVPTPVWMTGTLRNTGGGTIDFYGKDFRAGAIAGNGTLTNSLTFPTVLNLEANAGIDTFTGVISNGTGGLSIVKSGTGTQTLSGNNTYANGTTLSGGVLRVLNAANALGTGTLTLNGTSPELEIFATAGGSLTLPNAVTVQVTSEITSNTLTSGNGATINLGALSINASTLTISGGTNVAADTAEVNFASVTHTAAPIYTVQNPAGGGITRLGLGTLTGGTFTTTMNGNGEIIQTGPFTIATGAGTSAINYNGTGRLTLNQNNALTDRVTVTSGELVATANANALGSGSNVYLAGGTLILRDDNPITFGRPVFYTSNSSRIELDRNTAGAGVAFGMGTFTFNSGISTVNVDRGPNVTSGLAEVNFGTLNMVTASIFNIDTLCSLGSTQLSGNQTITKNRFGQLNLTGAVNGTRNVATTLVQGTLRLTVTNALASAAATLNLDSGTLVLAADANTAFNGTNVLVRTSAGGIQTDRLNAAATDMIHTINQLNWNASNLTLNVSRGVNITGAALGNVQVTTLNMNTASRTYNYSVQTNGSILWPTLTLAASTVVNLRGPGQVGQATGANLTAPTTATINQLGSGAFVLSGPANSIQSTINIDSGEVRVGDNTQRLRLLTIDEPGRFNPGTDTAFTLGMLINGVRQSPRLYGSQASPAQFRSDTLFAPGATGMLGLKGYLTFITAPTPGRSSFLFATPPAVNITDSLGVAINNSANTSPVRAFLTLNDANGRGRLRGDSVELMVNDRATFDSLRLGGRKDSLYRIGFVVDSLVTPVLESSNLFVTPGPIDPSLSFVVFSVDTAIANGKDSVQVTVFISDIDSNVIANEFVSLTQDTGKVSNITAENFSFSNSLGFARFKVSTTVADSIDYFAVIEVSGDEPFQDSARVYFVPGPPFRLQYDFQPYTAPINTVFFPSVQVSIFDSNNNRMWTDTNVVELSLFPTGFINGGSTATEVSGVATFPLVSIENGGTYIMVATVNDTVTVNSLEFDIIENFYRGGKGDGHFASVGREQTLEGRFILRITGNFTADDKVYDGTTAITSGGLTVDSISFSGLEPEYPNVSLDTLTYGFQSASVGDNKRVVVQSALLTGSDTSEYLLTLLGSPSGTARILGQSYFGGNGRGDSQAMTDTVFLDGTSAAPDRFELVAQLGDQLSNTPFTLRARLLAANNRPVPFGADSARISIFTNPGSLQLGGTVTQNLTSGEAVFSDITLDRFGNGARLAIEPISTPYSIDTTVTGSFDVYTVFSGGEGKGDDAKQLISRGFDGFLYDVWAGGTTGAESDWYTATNWSTERTPLDTSRILIPLRTHQPKLFRSSTPSLNAFTVASGGKLSLLNGVTLTLDSAATSPAADGPLLRVADGATFETLGSSRIVLEPGARYLNLSSGTPLLEVKQRLTGLKGWRMLSSPVRTTYADWLDSLETQGYTGSKYDSLQPNILSFAETDTGTTLQSWRKPANATDSIVFGRGYYAYVFNGAGYPANVSGGGNYRDTLPITLTASGKEPNLSGGAYFTYDELSYTPRSLSTQADTAGGNRFFLDENVADAGWNMLGNPTASTLSWDMNSGAWDKTNLDNTVYIWDPSFGGGVGGYRFWNGAVGNINDTTLESGLLAPYQGFWVHANAASPLLRFTNTAKTDTAQRYLSRRATPPTVSMRIKGAGMEANSFVSFDTEGITGPDQKDGYQLESYADSWLMLYTNSSALHKKPLVINTLPDVIENELAIPVHISASREGAAVNGNYRLEWDLTTNIPANWEIALMDHIGQRAISMTRYNFLDFSYTAPVQPTATRRTEASAFRAPGSVLHAAPEDAPVFRQQKPASRPFTIVVLPNYNGEQLTYRPDHPYLYPPTPNPFGEQTRISFYLPGPMDASIEVIDLYGRVMLREESRFYDGGTHEIDWYTARIPAGTYVIRLITNEFVSTQKGVKVR